MFTGGPSEQAARQRHPPRPSSATGPCSCSNPVSHLHAQLRVRRSMGERVRAYADALTHLPDDRADRWEDRRQVTVLPRAQDLTLEVIMRIVLGIRDDEARARLRTIYDVDDATPRARAIGHYFRPLLRPWKPVLASYLRKTAMLDQPLTEQIAAARADPDWRGAATVRRMLVRRATSRSRATDAEPGRAHTLPVAGHETTARRSLGRRAAGPTIPTWRRGASATPTPWRRCPGVCGSARRCLWLRPTDGGRSSRTGPTVPAVVAILVDSWRVHRRPGGLCRPRSLPAHRSGLAAESLRLPGLRRRRHGAGRPPAQLEIRLR